MKTRVLVVGLFTLCLNELSLACPVCYGASDSPMTDAMNTGILVLLGVTASVLTAFAAFFLRLRKRARMTALEHVDFTSLN